MSWYDAIISQQPASPIIGRERSRIDGDDIICSNCDTRRKLGTSPFCVACDGHRLSKAQVEAERLTVDGGALLLRLGASLLENEKAIDAWRASHSLADQDRMRSASWARRRAQADVESHARLLAKRAAIGRERGPKS